ncbi:MAG: hypothetical protein PHV06_07575 [bacterium]|nr:hypothetical protein [bacterium]
MNWIKIFDQEFVRDFLKKVVKHSYDDSQEILEWSKKNINPSIEINDTIWFQNVLSFVFFYLYLTERYALGNLSEELIKEFIPALEEVTLGFAIDVIYSESEIDPVKKEKIYNHSVNTFIVFKRRNKKFNILIPEKSELLKDSLIYDFTKSVSMKFIHKSDEDFQAHIGKLLIKSLQDIDFNNFIHNINKLSGHA